MEEAKKPFYKYCIVPKCTNTIRTTPDKVFFPVPRGAKVRNQWCIIMRRAKVSAISSLYVCEDHFNVMEDTANYVQYNIMKQQGEKICLRLKKGVVPHIFMCQKRFLSMPPPVESGICAIKRQKLAMVNQDLSESAVKSYNVLEVSEPPQTSQYEVCPSTSYTKVCNVKQKEPSISHTEVCDDNQAVPSTSHFNIYYSHQAEPSHLEDKLQSDKAVQVNLKLKYRSKGVNVNILTKKKNVALSPFPLSKHNIGTSPIKTALGAVVKRKLFTDSPFDKASISSILSMTSADYYEPSGSSELSLVQDDSEDEKQFKSVMRSCMLTAIEKEPKMLVGIPKQSYHLIKLLSENIPLPIIDILITLKKIKLNESFSILGLQFGYAQSTISRIFSTSIPLIAAKMKDLVVWPTPSDIYKNLPISFRSRYANVVSIIDCLEIQVEKPSNAVHQSLGRSTKNVTP